jgi:hypothetical protein
MSRFDCIILLHIFLQNKLNRQLQGQKRIENQETLVTLGSQDTGQKIHKQLRRREPTHVVTSIKQSPVFIKRSPFSCPVIDNFV